MKKIFLLLIFSLAWSQNFEPKAKGELVRHDYYSLDYIESHEQPSWVYYELKPSMIFGSIERKDSFKSDSKISTGSASLDDYKGSGYDRGHLAPAADMKVSSLSMSQSFFMSNMSPQDPSFNRGAWKELEALVRNWASSEEVVYILTGGILEEGLKTIGSNHVSVPNYYYKVAYLPSKSKMIAFLMPNRKIEKDLSSFIVSVNELEKITGYDFFYQLEDVPEEILESDSSSRGLDFNKKQIKTVKAETKKEAYSNQCQGITKAGNRCKRTVSGGGFCYQHD